MNDFLCYLKDTLAPILAAMSDFVTIISLLIGTIIAWVGLSTWRKQLRVGGDYELAKRVLAQVYKVRDAIEDIRGEFGVEIGGVNQDEYFFPRYSKAIKAVSDLEVELLGVEAVWGEKIKEKILKIRELVWDVKNAHNKYLLDKQREEYLQSGPKQRKAILKELSLTRQVLITHVTYPPKYDFMKTEEASVLIRGLVNEDNQNMYSNKLKKFIKDIELLLQSKLKI